MAPERRPPSDPCFASLHSYEYERLKQLRYHRIWIKAAARPTFSHVLPVVYSTLLHSGTLQSLLLCLSSVPLFIVGYQQSSLYPCTVSHILSCQQYLPSSR